MTTVIFQSTIAIIVKCSERAHVRRAGDAIKLGPLSLLAISCSMIACDKFKSESSNRVCDSLFELNYCDGDDDDDGGIYIFNASVCASMSLWDVTNVSRSVDRWPGTSGWLIFTVALRLLSLSLRIGLHHRGTFKTMYEWVWSMIGRMRYESLAAEA